MPNDIREIINSLDEQDKLLWNQHRTEMRRSYLTAHNSVIGVHTWDVYDDAFMDIIDLKLAILFDRAGRFAASKKLIIDHDEIDRVENEIIDIAKNLRTQNATPSQATQLMQGKADGETNGGWTSKP